MRVDPLLDLAGVVPAGRGATTAPEPTAPEPTERRTTTPDEVVDAALRDVALELGECGRGWSR